MVSFIHFKKRYPDDIMDFSRKISCQNFNPAVTPHKETTEKGKEESGPEFVQPIPTLKI